jgi:cbb3-type cytochrome oxidase subunit 3
MIVLYLFSIAIAWFVHPTQRKKRAAKAAGG